MTTAAPRRPQAYRGKPRLTFHKGVYLFWCGSGDTYLPKKAGLRWAEAQGYWWTREPAIASRLRDHADDIALLAFEGATSDARASLMASRATDADIDIPAPEGLNYMPFQRAGIAYALGKQSVLIGDDMGLGKTIQALGIINSTPEAEYILCIVPASLKINWRREAERWLVRKPQCYVIDDYFPASPGLFIINYERLHRYAQQLRNRLWDIMVVDECHRVKNPEARQSQQVYAVKARRRVFLSGTPMVNRPMEFFPLAHALAPHVFDSADSFRNRYGRADVRTQSGRLAMRELQTNARMSFMVRRLKKDVLTDLPPKVRQVIELPAGAATSQLQAERNAVAEHAGRLEELRTALEWAKVADDDEAYVRALAALKKASQDAAGATSKVRHQTALAKVPSVLAHVNRALEETGKIVLFAHHHDVIDAYVAGLPDAVKLTGQMNINDRQRSIDAFQNGKARVFVGSIQAAGVGITLTACSNVMFGELDWVPGNMTQAEDRCHRIGQKDSVTVQHLVFEGSIDADIAQTLVEKQAVIEAALDTNLGVENSGVPDEPLVPGMSQNFATAHVSRRRLQQDAEQLTDEAENATKFDTLNNVTLHPIDARLVALLREAPPLTPLQAALARRIVRKYAPADARAANTEGEGT